MSPKLAKVLEGLDYQMLKVASDLGVIACPFTERYNGPKPPGFRGNGKHCDYLCDELFINYPRDTVKDCPCTELGAYTVRNVFWAALDRAKEKVW